uniref:Protein DETOXIFICATION n=1 Tax=Aegilops tauschii subsp. strangulata TaxID=200361 RepID=A0A453SDF4_AEGTS
PSTPPSFKLCSATSLAYSSSRSLSCSLQHANSGPMCTTTPAPSAPAVAVSGGKGLHHVYVTLAQCADVHGHGGDAAGAHCHPQLKCHGVDGHAVPLTVNGGETFREAAALCRLACPIALTALLLYSRTALSMLFLGSLGDLQLAAGSLAVAFANITGYSVLSGLSLGMDPLCSQAFGANQPTLLGLTLYRSVLFLLCCSLPLSALWLNMSKILLFLGQDREITELAQQYLLSGRKVSRSRSPLPRAQPCCSMCWPTTCWWGDSGSAPRGLPPRPRLPTSCYSACCWRTSAGATRRCGRHGVPRWSGSPDGARLRGWPLLAARRCAWSGGGTR